MKAIIFLLFLIPTLSFAAEKKFEVTSKYTIGDSTKYEIKCKSGNSGIVDYHSGAKKYYPASQIAASHNSLKEAGNHECKNK